MQSGRRGLRNRWKYLALIPVGGFLLLKGAASRALAQEPPAVPEIDEAIQSFMSLAGGTAATVAISCEKQILYQRAYGFADSGRRSPTRDTTTMRIASCTKPFTAAAIATLVEQGVLRYDQPVFEYLGVPADWGPPADPRIRTVTIRHLLDHKGGWDRDATFDPLFSLEGIGRELKIQRPGKRHLARYMWTQPLQFDPGTTYCYSNFGYLLLGLVIEKAHGGSWIVALRDLVGQPLEIGDLTLSSSRPSARLVREVEYPRDSDLDARIHDSAGGLSTSAVSLCKFMDAWWLDGVRRESDRNEFLFQIGTHPGTTTALIEQRLDGLNYAILINARRDDSYKEDNPRMRAQFNEILDRVGADLRNR